MAGDRVRLSDALTESLTALDVAPQDQALAALLADYARELDGAAALEARARRTAEDVAEELGSDSALYERVQALQAALSRRTALDRIGARLHAGLVEMLGTPRSRAGKPGSAGADAVGQEGKAPGRLGELYLASGGDT